MDRYIETILDIKSHSLRVARCWPFRWAQLLRWTVLLITLDALVSAMVQLGVEVGMLGA